MDKSNNESNDLSWADKASQYRAVMQNHADQKTPHFYVAVATIIVLILLSIYWLFKGPKHKHAGLPTVTVVSGKSKAQDVPVYLIGLGSVTPLDTVNVKTQIDGQLIRVLYKEGQIVKIGDLLAEINPRPYEAQLLQYQGQLERDQALLANARIDLCRYTQLFAEDSISQQTLETQKWLVKQYEGDVKTDLGLIQGVKTNLIYCRITSPVNGRVGLRLVDPGNFVQTTDTSPLFVLNTINPTTVIFTLPEDNIPQVTKAIQKNPSLVAEAFNRSQTQRLAEGELLTIDNVIDPTTGTVKLRAQFKNTEGSLFPSQFVNVRLLVDTLHNATVIPTAALLHGREGSFVYVIENKNIVKVRPIKTGAVVGDETVITAGLKPNETIVIEGTDKLVDGATVKIGKDESV